MPALLFSTARRSATTLLSSLRYRLIIALLFAIGLFAFSTALFSTARPSVHALAQGLPVVIIGAGMAGAKLAHDLHERKIPFLLLEATDRVGGRLRRTQLYPNGPFVELGANWLQGVRRNDPFHFLALRIVGLHAIPDDVDNIRYFSNGSLIPSAITSPLEARLTAALDATYRLRRTYAMSPNDSTILDMSIRDALLLTKGWLARTPLEHAIQQEEIDYEYARDAALISIHELSPFYDPDEPSTSQFFVRDPRGFREIVSWHLRRAGISDVDKSGPLLRLQAPVAGVEYSSNSAIVRFRDGGRIRASAVVSTASVGVLRASLDERKNNGSRLEFEPRLPYGKRRAISKLTMTTYVKFFIQFHTAVFTKDDPLYIKPLSCRENAFVNLQNLNKKGYFPGENLVMVTAVGTHGREMACESMDDALRDALHSISSAVGRKVLPSEVVKTVFPPFIGSEFFHGMYSGRPVGVTDEDLREFNRPLGALFFAGEAHYWNQGYVQSAWYSAAETAKQVAKFLETPR